MTGPALFLMFVLIAEMVFFAIVAPRVRKRFGVVGLIIGALATWYASLFASGMAKRLGGPELRGKIDMLGTFTLLASLIGVLVISVQVVRQGRRLVSGDSPGYSSAKSASQAVAIGVGVVIILAFTVLVLFSQMAP